ncbi:hypothetical protein J421_4631 (plasmid) [Gemmatirosa kalamazoonensis]|uniref:DNA-binding phage zinc finger domain-containing protein n=1 Tax=Gemmatirosa kalamazoonensis TaxID=861299 RepID=W0RR83_9BACT|nr:hypothetical protein [Gemmatirosa kalamazoonensis]AHG92098.1 hypothetical protein J421_4563 [Gemmatirosa kalamazoonensis]AHG92166.1 hypothetical protein J421_4631 [Gemmatirosa kalamazoonensis]
MRLDKRTRDLIERWEHHPALAVPCPRCHKAPGEPCVSCLGNVTLPHIPRVIAAERAPERGEAAAHG